jgi:hypothetical protein
MPSLNSRMVDITNTHVRAREPMGAPAPVSIPTPHPPFVGRHPRMISSMPSIFATQDGPMRQFYGTGHLPVGRVSLT